MPPHHACPLPCMPPRHTPLLPCMPPCHACPPPHMPPLPHTPLPCMPPTMHAPLPCPSCHAPLPHMPPCHARLPTTHTSPLVNRMTDRCKNITLPQTSFAGGNNHLKSSSVVNCITEDRYLAIHVLG